MSKFILFTDGILSARYDSNIHGERTISIIDPSFVWPQVEQANYQYDPETSLDGPTIFVDDPGITPPTILVENPDCKIPAEAVEVSEELFYQTINEQDGIWSLVDGEIVKLPFPAATPEQLSASIRAERDRKIADVAWRYERIARQDRLGISPIDNIAVLDAYVQALADITEQEGFPQSVTWPEVPV